jgi:hypothetical protein
VVERIKSIEKSSLIIRNQICNLAACSIVLQPTVLPICPQREGFRHHITSLAKLQDVCLTAKLVFMNKNEWNYTGCPKFSTQLDINVHENMNSALSTYF